MTLICYMKYIEDFDLYDKIWRGLWKTMAVTEAYSKPI